MKQNFLPDEVKELIDDFLSEKITITKLTEILNDRADISYGNVMNGIIIKHRDAPETYGGVAVATGEGNFAIAVKDQKEAAERIGQEVKCRQDFSCYKMVEILEYI